MHASNWYVFFTSLVLLCIHAVIILMALVAKGRTQVFACVIGPSDVRARRDLPDRASLEVNVQPENPILAQTLRSAFSGVILLSQFPHGGVDINVEVLHSDGSETACAFNAVMLAILDAGLPCHGVACGVSLCASISQDGASQILVDPTTEELDKSGAAQVFLASIDGRVLSSVLRDREGICAPGRTVSLIEYGVACAQRMVPTVRNIMQHKFAAMIGE